MDNKQTIKLIYLYRKHTLLWNLKDHEHYDFKKRLQCWKEIAKELPFTVLELKKKMTSLLGSYRREKSKERRSRANGSKYVYKSRWYGTEHFEKDLGHGDQEKLAFQDINNDPMMSLNTIVKLEPGEPTRPGLPPTNGKKYSIRPPPHLLRKRTRSKKQAPEKAILEQACEALEKISAQNDSNPLHEETVGVRRRNEKISPMTRKKARKELSTKAMLEQVSELLDHTVNTKDPYNSFGTHIANELRKYDQKILSRVKYEINRVIHNADMGKYDGNEV